MPLRITAALLGLTLVSSALACRRSGPPLPVWTGGDAGTPLSPPPTHSAGCARSDSSPTGVIDRTARVAGHDRRYLMVVPPGAARDRPLPVVFFFQGRTRIGAGVPSGRKLAGGLGELPEVAGGAIFVVPQGTPFPAEGVIGWYEGCPSEDVDFFDAMLASIGESHCIDPGGVLVTGVSWGAEMALALGCCRGEKIRALAVASGSDLASIPRCPARTIPAFRATYAAAGDGVYKKEELAASVAFFRQVHHCAVESDPVEPAPCVAYRGCAKPVVDCAYRPFGHFLPPDFARATWDFFTQVRAR
jgi:poly(3-hydroxybutyrate) depolymerase